MFPHSKMQLTLPLKQRIVSFYQYEDSNHSQKIWGHEGLQGCYGVINSNTNSTNSALATLSRLKSSSLKALFGNPVRMLPTGPCSDCENGALLTVCGLKCLKLHSKLSFSVKCEKEQSKAGAGAGDKCQEVSVPAEKQEKRNEKNL